MKYPILIVYLLNSVIGQIVRETHKRLDECNGIFTGVNNILRNDNLNVCCDSQCINPETGLAQCGGTGCRTFLSHLVESENITETEAIRRGQNGCCILEIKWDYTFSDELCSDLNNEAPCLTEDTMVFRQRRLDAIFAARPPRPRRRRTWWSGDPHFKTLDGRDYTYDGIGTFWFFAVAICRYTNKYV